MTPALRDVAYGFSVIRFLTGVVRLVSLDRRIAAVQTIDDSYAVVDVQAGRLPPVGEPVSCAVDERGVAPVGMLPLVVVVHAARLTLAQVQELFGPLFW